MYVACADAVYSKLPEDIAERWVLLLDPMLATGGSAIQAIQVLVDHGVQPSKILFLNMIASPEGLHNVWEAFPDVRVISAWVDTKLSDQNYSTSRVLIMQFSLAWAIMATGTIVGSRYKRSIQTPAQLGVAAPRYRAT